MKISKTTGSEYSEAIERQNPKPPDQKGQTCRVKSIEEGWKINRRVEEQLCLQDDYDKYSPNLRYTNTTDYKYTLYLRYANPTDAKYTPYLRYANTTDAKYTPYLRYANTTDYKYTLYLRYANTTDYKYTPNLRHVKYD
ncbi:hypothetical protein FIBSPDRAFT_885267 [Athelia psychrophila]|uniref:Uncharacterized protein n=1 Tax=Athelia psychrophila TaxID=1759441 RepID=A0A166S9P5_9AGAM|nr:hypothetical protein FIBSPDRAFT_885267 [Fibularhizoctonia sp. CBS 109695]